MIHSRTTTTAATTVVDGYGGRAQFARAEAETVPRPRLLRGLLRSVEHVAELPYAALNQLACQTPSAELLTAIGRTLQRGVDLLAQVLCIHSGGRVDTAGFYDPFRKHGVWFADRYLDPACAAGAVLRRRRQYRHHVDGTARVRVEFDYLDSIGASLLTTGVELRLFSVEALVALLTTAGFRHIRFLPGCGGLSEILAQTDSGDHQ
ncbi:MAG: hypothetical protein ACRDTC_00900 [Pseudonocardiaceae bacterium]